MISSLRNFCVHILDAYLFKISLFSLLDIKSNYLPGIVHTWQKPSNQLHMLTSKDLTAMPDLSSEIQESYNLYYASCIGLLIYTHYLISCAGNEQAKYSRQPAKAHHISYSLNMLHQTADTVSALYRVFN
jgi:hypothetical protein